MVEGGMKCVKYLLFAFNLIFFLTGLALIIAGAVVQFRFNSYFDIFGGSFSAAAILLIVVGLIIFVIGFFGCCGAYKEVYCMVMTFAILLGLVFILEIAAGIAAYVLRNDVRNLAEVALSTSITRYMHNNSTPNGVTKAWDLLQSDRQCCGANNRTDWSRLPEFGNNNVPNSCCTKPIANPSTCGQGQQRIPVNGTNLHVYTEGCIDASERFVKSNILYVGIIGIVLAFIQVFGIIIACCLARSIKKDYEVV